MRRRTAFTMVELLIVIAIITILISLLLPAIQSAREQARRTHCVNNLMQLGIALANYAATHSVLPPGVVNDQGPILNLPSGYHHSWVVQILPFVGQDNVYRHFNITEGVYEPSNETAAFVKISTLLCPSDEWMGPISYAGCHHDVDAPIAADNHGVLYLNSRVRPDDIPDGPAYTILLGEMRRAGPSLGWASGTRATLRNTGKPINERDPLLPLFPRTGGFRNIQPPVSQAELHDVVKSLTADEIWPVTLPGGFSSWHAGGSNFLFCDGSVHLLKASIDRRIYQFLGNRDDGEAVSADSY
jgi:prepilin-type processing-associated H-X9-DG protein/prepilin-type N-terminal cleavage/methylation domain-containing protein